jgi:uncharacterized membrane protein
MHNMSIAERSSRRYFLAVALAVLLTLTLVFLNPDVPILRQVFGFISLSFIPGFLILKILRLRGLSAVDTLLYSVGLSISLVMFLGLFMNMLLPHVGVERPISVIPVILTWTIVVFILLVVAYMRERADMVAGPADPSVHWSVVLSPPTLFLVLLPVLCVLGTRLANLHESNVLLLVLIILIALVVVLITINKFVHRELYPLAVGMIGLSLLWYYSLISPYLAGWDIHREYYYQNLVLVNSSWDWHLPSNLNAMLSVTMMAPIYSIVLDMNSVWVFKIVYPVLFSLVPLALFQVIRKQTDDKIAFLATFFFMAMNTFFMEMTQLARQQVAELFLALTLLVLLDSRIAPVRRSLLLIIFGFSIVVSHYGTSYMYMFYLVFALLLVWLATNGRLVNLSLALAARFTKVRRRGGSSTPTDGSAKDLPRTAAITPGFALLIVVAGLGWYAFVATGYPFHSVVNVGRHVYDGVGEIFTSGSRDVTVLRAVGVASTRGTGVAWEVARILQWVTQLFIIIGILGLFLDWLRVRFRREYVAMSLVSTMLLAMSIVLPFFAGALGMTRLYHLTLFFLAPFCILGGIEVLRGLGRLGHAMRFPIWRDSVYLNVLVVLVLVPYFLFNTGLVFQLTGATSTSIALDSRMDYPRLNAQEVSGRKWLSSVIGPNDIVYADFYGGQMLEDCVPESQVEVMWGDTAELPDATYVFLRSVNADQDKVFESEDQPSYTELRSSPLGQAIFLHQSKVYDSGSAELFSP